MEIPTGEDDERDSVGTLPQPLQLGSGAVDVIAGGAYTFQTLDYEMDTDLRVKINRSANQFNFGDVFWYNFSYQKQILPVTLPDKGIYSQWNALLELNGSVAEKNDSMGIEVANSGGHTLSLSPRNTVCKSKSGLWIFFSATCFAESKRKSTWNRL